MNLAALRQQRREQAAVVHIVQAARANQLRLAAIVARLEARSRPDGLAWSGPVPTALRAVEGDIRSMTAGVVLRVR